MRPYVNTLAGLIMRIRTDNDPIGPFRIHWDE